MDHIGDFCQQFGLPESVGAAWRGRGIGAWTALQEAAWRAGVPREAEHCLIAGPTSAGKTMVAEAAAACAVSRGRKVLWLAPTRALAAQVAGELAATLEGMGARVRCATRETAAAEDAQIFKNQFEVLVAVYEKAAAWAARQPHGLAEVGLVVADELTMLRDPERGGRLDLLLTMLQSSPYAPRRLGLTLPVPNMEELARWWGGRLLVCGERPRPLREGVLDLASGHWLWRNRAGAEEGEEALEERRTIERWITRGSRALEGADWPPLRAATAAVAAGLASRGEATLLFASSRALARAWAEGVAEAFTLAPAPEAMLERARGLAAREASFDHRLLARTLERGVGVHHADLAPEARRLVEEAFREGRIRLLVATPTLAQGVNLAARNVIHWPERVEAAAGGAAGGAGRLALERWRFADQGGRAGRLGLGEGAGRSILVAWDGRQAEALWERYIAQEAEPIASGLAGGELGAALLACLAGDVARTRGNLREFFAGTFAGATAWRERPEELEAKLERAVATCKEGELLREEGLEKIGTGNGRSRRVGIDYDYDYDYELRARKDGMRLTGMGQICAALGIEPETAARLRPWLGAEAGVDLESETPLGALCGLALAAPTGLWPAGARPGRSPIAGELRGWFEEEGRRVPGALAAVLEQPGGPTARELAALEAAWRLSLWIGPEPTERVERRTGWTAGSLARAGEGLAWIAEGAAALTLAGGGRLAAAEGWRELGRRLAAGVTREGAELARLRMEELGRGAMQALCAAGITTARELAEAEVGALSEVLGDKALARRARVAARRGKREAGGMGGMGEMGPMGPIRKEVERVEERLRERERSIDTGDGRRMGVGIEHGQEHEQEHEHETDEGGRAGRPLIEIDLQSPGVVRVAGGEMRLTPLDYDLLAALAERPGSVMTRQALYQRLWPDAEGPEDQQLDAHRRRLARQLGAALGVPAGQAVETIRGVGFRLNLPECSVVLQRG